MLSRPDQAAGHTTTAGEWATLLDEIDARGIVARGSRPTNSAGVTTTETSVVRLDNVALKASRLYVVRTNAIQVFSTVAGDTVKVNLRYTTTGVAATTASTILATTYERAHVAGGAGGGAIMFFEYLPVQVSDVALSVLLTLTRNTGTGTVNLLANIDMFIEAFGADPGDTGIDL